jgi:hypothetical protein
MKDSLLLGAWVGGILLLGTLLWLLTRSPREEALRHSVNQVLELRGDSRRLAVTLPRRDLRWGVPLRGTWYARQDGEGWALVFSLMAEGTRLPCAALISPGGQVEELIPLSLSGEKLLARLPPEVTGLYIRRIEVEARP